MIKLAPWILALAVLQGSALFAQNIVGTWQGALKLPQGGKQLRIVFKISTTDNDTLKAVMYSIDQGGQGIAITQFTRQGSDVKMVVGGIGGTYDGKLSADGNAITGNWTQGPMPMMLNLARANAETAWTIPEPPKPLANPDPAFEVATIKPSKPGAPGKAFTMRGQQFKTFNTTLVDMISLAYKVHARQIIGGPPWMGADKFDVDAKPEGKGAPNEEQIDIMLRKLLAERFKLSFHRDKKELAVYALVIGKNGPKLTKSAGDPNGLPGLMFRGLGVLPVTNATMTDFAGTMQGAVLDRPVVDHTGLTGKWDFTLKWTPDETQFAALGVHPPAPPENAAEPDLFTAIQEQAGLKLESTKAFVEVLVIDHVEKPSEN
jgi:bla regulator protein blaR1